MTLQIAFLFALLAVMVWSFMTEKLPVELTAFIGLLVLIFAGYVEPSEAFTGFASPAVITMFSIFFISGALLVTGIADLIGGQLAKLSGGREIPLIILLMLVAGVLSAFMNNVAAAAVLLPAVSSVARHAGISPSRLFMPLSFGAILGGTTTLVGTPPNILAAEVLQNRGFEPFSLFDFTPIGLALLGTGILYMVTIGRRLLPERAEAKQAEESSHLTRAYRIEERMTSIRIPPGSPLDGLELRDARLGQALDVKVLAVERGEKKHLAPAPDFRLAGDDVLVVDGRFKDLQKLLAVQGVGVEETDPGHLGEISALVQGVVLRLPRGSGLIGRSLRQLRFRDRFGVLVVGVRRGRDLVRQHLARRVLRPTDEILALGTPEQIEALSEQRGFEVVERGVPLDQLFDDQRLTLIHVPATSSLVGSSLLTSRLSELAGVTVIGIVRQGATRLAVSVDEDIQADDDLLLASEPTRIIELLKLGELELRSEKSNQGLGALESSTVGVTEAVVAPRSRAAGRNLKKLRFREHYGLQVLALWRGGHAIHKDLADIPLRFGDALLLHGPREKVDHLAEDTEDFVVLGREQTAVRRIEKAPVAVAALAVMIALVASGLYPIHVAAFAGAVTSVLFGALKMDEAYRMIEWRAIFLVAAILPVGVAMERSGAALWMADIVSGVAENHGPYAFLASLVVLSSLLSQGLDGAPTVVILAPVVLLTAEQLGLSPYPMMMAVGLSASAAFMTPFSHKANLLVMSAGGYRAMDYVKVGTPLTLLVFVLLVVLVPIFFPFTAAVPVP